MWLTTITCSRKSEQTLISTLIIGPQTLVSTTPQQPSDSIGITRSESTDDHHNNGFPLFEIKSKNTHSPHSLYLECGLLCLISACRSMDEPTKVWRLRSKASAIIGDGAGSRPPRRGPLQNQAERNRCLFFSG